VAERPGDAVAFGSVQHHVREVVEQRAVASNLQDSCVSGPGSRPGVDQALLQVERVWAAAIASGRAVWMAEWMAIAAR
jgi:hypothetical protein